MTSRVHMNLKRTANLIEFLWCGVEQLTHLPLAVRPHLKCVLHHADHLSQRLVQDTLKFSKLLKCSPRQSCCDIIS